MSGPEAVFSQGDTLPAQGITPDPASLEGQKSGVAASSFSGNKGTLERLREENPEWYDALLETIVMKMGHESDKHFQRMKKKRTEDQR